MRYFILTLLLLVIALTRANAQLNVELLHQLVEHSKDEYDRQITARNRQAITSANEEVNREETAKLKTRYRQLHSRFQVLGTALQGLSMGLESAPIVTEIINQQKRIIGIVSTHPEFLLLAIDAEKDMAEKAVQLARYLTGLFISIGDLNQMKASDRRILYCRSFGRSEEHHGDLRLPYTIRHEKSCSIPSIHFPVISMRTSV